MAKLVSSASMAASALAFGPSSELPFLAAGSAPGSDRHRLAFYRIAARGRDAELVEMFSYWSPAPFCRISWSKPKGPTRSSPPYPTGLVAGGLESGAVAIWDPREDILERELGSTSLVIVEDYLDRLESSGYYCGSLATGGVAAWHPLFEDCNLDSSLDIIEDFFTPPTARLNFDRTISNGIAGVHQTRTSLLSDPKRFVFTSYPISPSRITNALCSNRDIGSTGAKWMLPFDIVEDYFTPEGPIPSSTANPVENSMVEDSMVAILSYHKGAVRGLSFSTTVPQLLASAATNGSILISDLINPCAKNIPSFQCTQDSNAEVSYLSWSPLLSNTLSSASSVGVALWDFNMKHSLIREFSKNENCSVAEWSPMDKNLMLIATRDDWDLPALKVWDLRNMNKPIKEICNGTKGILTLSWSMVDENAVVACTGNGKVLLVNVKKGEVVCEEEMDDPCLDIQWSSDGDCFAASSSKEIRMYHRKGSE